MPAKPKAKPVTACRDDGMVTMRVAAAAVATAHPTRPGRPTRVRLPAAAPSQVARATTVTDSIGAAHDCAEA